MCLGCRRLRLLDLPGADLLVQVRREERERRALTDQMDQMGARFIDAARISPIAHIDILGLVAP